MHANWFSNEVTDDCVMINKTLVNDDDDDDDVITQRKVNTNNRSVS